MAPGTAVAIEPATPSDLPQLVTLLGRCGLPRAGLEAHLGSALVARRGGAIVGSAVLELYGKYALLRSVAVDESLRGQALGMRLTGAALDLAEQRRVERVFLLTETASKFFPRFGFREISRAEVPLEVKRSEEFAGACPDTAVAMERPVVAREPPQRG